VHVFLVVGLLLVFISADICCILSSVDMVKRSLAFEGVFGASF
jgi:hypothetical protein